MNNWFSETINEYLIWGRRPRAKRRKKATVAGDPWVGALGVLNGGLWYDTTTNAGGTGGTGVVPQAPQQFNSGFTIAFAPNEQRSELRFDFVLPKPIPVRTTGGVGTWVDRFRVSGPEDGETLTICPSGLSGVFAWQMDQASLDVVWKVLAPHFMRLRDQGALSAKVEVPRRANGDRVGAGTRR